ncbi:hypothetical protein PV325_000197, partial [Microctonus aethiopoides]
MNIPPMSQKTYKHHERILKPTIEQINQEGLEKAIREQRECTLKNIKELKKY